MKTLTPSPRTSSGLLVLTSWILILLELCTERSKNVYKECGVH
ncbi:hypothetical protein TcasGA2_TC031493 [Tribolium castaneum]|uniref:Uncharacterized protein n=1 Tax=Tribolium castaneum TaxID=7070 RepID=A0A139WNN4_TRICA|nr:hypothetical protein TcasGA2_TC031493 [Tribolium castaneum]